MGRIPRPCTILVGSTKVGEAGNGQGKSTEYDMNTVLCDGRRQCHGFIDSKKEPNDKRVQLWGKTAIASFDILNAYLPQVKSSMPFVARRPVGLAAIDAELALFGAAKSCCRGSDRVRSRVDVKLRRLDREKAIGSRFGEKALQGNWLSTAVQPPNRGLPVDLGVPFFASPPLLPLHSCPSELPKAGQMLLLVQYCSRLLTHCVALAIGSETGSGDLSGWRGAWKSNGLHISTIINSKGRRLI